MTCVAEIRPVLKAFCPDRKKIYLYMVRCKSWYCPTCGHINKLTWVAKIAQGIDEYYEQGIKDWMFCTVTSHPKLTKRGQCLWVEPRAWKKLWSRIHYHHGKVRYVYIPELHGNGRTHWHMLMSGGIPVKWWKYHAPRSGFGYMFDSQPVRDGRKSVLYVTKELSKGLAITKWPRKLRRIRTNQRWPEIATGDDYVDLRLSWDYLRQDAPENLETLREEIEKKTGITTVILGTEQ